MNSSELIIRLAELNEGNEIQRLIDKSARALAVDDYTSEQIEVALQGVWGLDSQLLTDRTYFVACFSEVLVGCGGWSKRHTLFGGDDLQGRNSSLIDPITEAAKIRAFFIHPDYARKGIGSKILKRCEIEANKCGYRRLELGATLPGKRLYQSHGYIAGTPYEYECVEGKFMTIVPMSKAIAV